MRIGGSIGKFGYNQYTVYVNDFFSTPTRSFCISCSWRQWSLWSRWRGSESRCTATQLWHVSVSLLAHSQLPSNFTTKSIDPSQTEFVWQTIPLQLMSSFWALIEVIPWWGNSFFCLIFLEAFFLETKNCKFLWQVCTFMHRISASPWRTFIFLGNL